MDTATTTTTTTARRHGVIVHLVRRYTVGTARAALLAEQYLTVYVDANGFPLAVYRVANRIAELTGLRARPYPDTPKE